MMNYKKKYKKRKRTQGKPYAGPGLGVLPVMSTLPHMYASAKTIGVGMSQAAVSRDPGAAIRYGTSGMLLTGVAMSMRPATNFMAEVLDSTRKGLGVKKKYQTY